MIRLPFFRPQAAPPAPAMTPRHQVWLWLAAGLSLLPHQGHVPTWVSVACAAIMLWRAWLWRTERPLPPNWLLTLLVAAATAAVYAHFHLIFGREPGMVLLILLVTLKLLECRSHRDGLTLLFLICFLQMGLFFYSQTLPTAAYAIATLLVAIATLAALHREESSPGLLLRQSGLMLLQAIPFALVLFVLFPRVTGPLWGMPSDAYSGNSGLSDTMTPGSINELMQSDAIAFRAQFDTQPPPPAQRYWRGPVLSHFDGRTWRALPSPRSNSLPYILPDHLPDPHTTLEAFRPQLYSVTLEPHNRNWLFALEFPAFLPTDSQMTEDFRLLAKEPVRNRLRYQLGFVPLAAAGNRERAEVLRANLQLPPGFNPRTRALAEQWRQDSQGDPEQIIRTAITFYRSQGFAYTLYPPLLGSNSVDEFIFDTRRGFCEHFAGSFVFALRAAGVPARVVTGYQGGEMNPVDHYLMVRQMDAHAWTEAWLPGKGWQRLDPTALAAPIRIDADVAAALPRGERLPFNATQIEWLKDLRYRWQAVSNGWNQWVLGYNAERQKQFLNQLGLPRVDYQGMTLLLFLLCAGLGLALTFWIIRQRQMPDPVQRAWLGLCRKLARHGLERQPDEGPLDYSRRIAQARPSLAAELQHIAALYIGLRYGDVPPDSRAAGLKPLRRAIARLRP